MAIQLGKAKLPKKYIRCGRECYLDPIRKKLIFITPEETVRQQVISYLTDVLCVPSKMLAVEEHLSHYGISSNKRADIVIHKTTENGDVPIAVVECKAPDVYLSDRGHNQMLDYCDALGADYAMLINGVESFCYKYQNDNYVQIQSLPTYAEMLDGRIDAVEIEELPERIPFSGIGSYLRETFDSFGGDNMSTDISPQTEMRIAVPAFNLLEGLLDTRHKMPSGDYGYYKLIAADFIRAVRDTDASDLNRAGL